MGGMNEKNISGLRIHLNDTNMVHIHDDSKNLKFEINLNELKKEIKNSFQALKNKDGLCEITNNSDCILCIIKNHKKFNLFLLDKKSNIKKEILDFLK